MKIFTMSFQNVWNHMLEWFRVAYAPLVIFVLGFLFMIFTYWYVGFPLDFKSAMMSYVNKETEFPTDPLIQLGNGVYFITHLIFAISIYINNIRYGVLHEGGKRWWTLHLNWRFLKMILYALVLGILGGAYVLFAAGIIIGAHYLLMSVAVDVLLGTVFFIYGLYLLFRISLYGVLIAIDKPNPIRTSWALLKGNVLRLLGLYLLLILSLLGITLLGVMGLGLVGIALDLISVGISMILICIFVFFMFQFIFLAVLAKASALVYQMVSGDKAR